VLLGTRPVERTEGAGEVRLEVGWDVGKVAVMGPPENNVE
jgi:hypothetical protein